MAVIWKGTRKITFEEGVEGPGEYGSGVDGRKPSKEHRQPRIHFESLGDLVDFAHHADPSPHWEKLDRHEAEHNRSEMDRHFNHGSEGRSRNRWYDNLDVIGCKKLIGDP